MTWQQRLAALVLAGGALAVAGCGDDSAMHGGQDLSVVDMAVNVIGTCNGNPDPCCLHPTGPTCPRDGGTHD